MKVYDLEDRTMEFSKNVMSFCKGLSKDRVLFPLVDQLVRSSTSIGANYCEANGASSTKDFINKIFICKKEAKETLYWLELMSSSFEVDRTMLEVLISEVKQLVLIFGKISSKRSK